MHHRLLSTLLGIGFLSVTMLSAQEAVPRTNLAANPPSAALGELPRHLELTSFPATMIDEVIVPHPGELFLLMDKLPGQPNWRSKVRHDLNASTSTDRTQLALLFGTLIADGFIAVQAKDVDGVKTTGLRILDLSSDLSLRQAVLPHSQAIIEACERGDWGQVREELDRTHKTVRDQMEQMRDDDLAQFVSVAGWVRGTEVLTSLITESYSRDKAEILHQPDLADHFIQRLVELGNQDVGNSSIETMLEGLKRVRSLMETPENESLPSDAVEHIHRICSEIVKVIVPD